MNVLVTGGAGYIGSHVVNHLLQAGHRVVVLDDLSHGHKIALRQIDPHLPFVRGNVGDWASLEAAYSLLAFEAVLHFAAFIEVAESCLDPIRYYQNNTAATFALLSGMNRLGVRTLIFSSTAAVYGNPNTLPIIESSVCSPLNPYGQSKRMVEIALADLVKAQGFGVTILRYFNVAGAHPTARIGEAHEPETHLIPRILAAAGNPAEEFAIFGTDYPTRDGTCIRDYVHVEDLASGHLLALEAVKPGKLNVYNLGSEEGFSVREVLAACEKVTGQKIHARERGRRPGDPAVLIASSEKIRRELAWQPIFPEIVTMVQHAWAWQQASIRALFKAPRLTP